MNSGLESISTPLKTSANPQQKSSATNSKNQKNGQNNIEHLYSLIINHLSNHQISQASKLANNQQILLNVIRSELFQQDLQSILSHQMQANEINSFVPSSVDPSKRQDDLLSKAKKLKERKSLNTCLINTVFSLLTDLIRGIHIDERKLGNSQVFKKLKIPVLKIQSMLKGQNMQNNKEFDRQVSIENQLITSLKEQLELCSRQLKHKKEQITKLKKQLSASISKNNDLKKTINIQQNLWNKKYIEQLEKINTLILENSIQEQIDSEIRATFNDIRDSICFLHKQNEIDTDERNNLKSKVILVQLLVNKKIINFTLMSSQEQNIIADLNNRISKQERKIQELMTDFKSLNESPSSERLEQDLLSRSNASYSSLQGQPKKQKIRRNNIQKLTETIKEKEKQIAQLNRMLDQQGIEIDILKSESSQNEENIMATRQVKQLQMLLKEKTERLKAMEKSSREKIDSLMEQLSKKQDQLAKSLDKQMELYELVKVQMEELKQLHSKEKLDFKTQKQKLELQIQSLQSLQSLNSKIDTDRSKQDCVDHYRQTSLQLSLMSEKQMIATNTLQYSKVSVLESNVKNVEGDKEEIQTKMSTLNEQYQELMAQNITLHNQVDDLRQKLTNTQKFLQYHKSKQKQSEQKLNIANKKLKALISTQEFKRQHEGQNVEHIFQCEILQESPSDKLFLKKLLEQRYKSKIFKTKLIYKYDPLNKTNFHHYIDHKEGIFVLIKLVNGICVAGYYQGKIVPKLQADKDAILISVTNKEVFQLDVPNRKGITYDEFYFILGNSEIRLKSGQKKLFSNFGLNNGFFRPRGHKVSTLMGSNDRELEFEDLSFYQIFYF